MWKKQTNKQTKHVCFFVSVKQEILEEQAKQRLISKISLPVLYTDSKGNL